MNRTVPGLGLIGRSDANPTKTEFVVTQQPLHRVLAFTRHNIDDVINNPMARREVLGYYKLYRWVSRGCEIAELERQWNPNGYSR